MAKKSAAKDQAIAYNDDAWRAEDDARTLIRAIEIRNDKARFAKAKAWAKEQANKINNITKD